MEGPRGGRRIAKGARQQGKGQQSYHAEIRSLQVTNLHPNVTEDMLQDVLRPGGFQVEVDLVKKELSGSTLDACFLDFTHHSVAREAMSKIQGKLLHGQALHVKLAFYRRQREDRAIHFDVMVLGLAPGVDDRALFEAFNELCDGCCGATVMRNLRTGISIGNAIVSFSKEAEAEAAVMKMDGRSLSFKPMQCRLA